MHLSLVPSQYSPVEINESLSIEALSFEYTNVKLFSETFWDFELLVSSL